MNVILAYHGCDVEAAQALLSGSRFKLSNKAYDWLGSGSYFWEQDIVRAYEWSQERRPHAPCVVGAAIDLGNCLDLTTRAGVMAVRNAYRSYLELQKEIGQPLPINYPSKQSLPGELSLRSLDRAVIDHLHVMYRQAAEESGGRIREFDTVRAMFPEGQPLYENAGFQEKTHVQIAVRKPEQVLGVFRIPEHRLRELALPDLYRF